MSNFNFIPFPILTTHRLILRRLEMTDDAEIYSLRSDDRVNEFLDRPKTISIEQARAFIAKIDDGIVRGQSLYWVITQKQDGKLAGTICLWNLVQETATGEVGYELKPEFQGKGIMQEALSAVLDYAFQVMKLEGIEACTHADNARSSRLLEKYDFRRKANPGDLDTGKEVIYFLERPKEEEEKSGEQ